MSTGRVGAMPHILASPEERLPEQDPPISKAALLVPKPFRTSTMIGASATAQQRDPKIATATSTLSNTFDALAEAAHKLHDDLDGVADLVLCICTCDHEAPDVLEAAMPYFTGIPFAGNTSHGGLVTETHNLRVGASRSKVFALWAIRDGYGTFAVASAAVTDGDYQGAGKSAAQIASAEVSGSVAGRDEGDDDGTGGSPAGSRAPRGAMTSVVVSAAARRRHEMLMWLYTAPGHEEDILTGMIAGAPRRTIILGSSSADNDLEGLWWQAAAPANGAAASFCGAQVGSVAPSEGAVVVCMRPSVDFTPIYSHGFGATVHSATVVANKDGDARMIKTLRPTSPPGAAPMPAAELFNRWTGGEC